MPTKYSLYLKTCICLSLKATHNLKWAGYEYGRMTLFTYLYLQQGQGTISNGKDTSSIHPQNVLRPRAHCTPNDSPEPDYFESSPNRDFSHTYLYTCSCL